MVSCNNLHIQIMLCSYKLLSNLKTQISKEYFNIDYFIWVMIYHKIISNLKSPKFVILLTGVIINNDSFLYDHTQNWQISNLKSYLLTKSLKNYVMILQGTVQYQNSNLKRFFYIHYFICVMIYHKLISNLKS